VRMNSTGVKNESDVTGFRPPAPGRYHAVVKYVDDSFAKTYGEKNNQALIVEFQILAGTVPGQENLTHKEMMFLRDGGPTDQHLRFALVTGLMQAGTEADVNFQNAVGRQLIIALEKNTSKKDSKEYTNLAEYGMAMWGLNNPEVKDVPRLPGPGQRQQQAPPMQQQMPMPQQQPPQGYPPQGQGGYQQYPQQAPQQHYQQPPQQFAPPPQQHQQPATNDGGWGSI
jgi:hypothetical protein